MSSTGTSQAGAVSITQGGGGDAVITGLSPTTWLWNSGSWSVVSGPGNGFNSPQQGDSAIVTSGTVVFGNNPQLTSNTIYLGGTAGVAALSGVGDNSTSLMSPSLDSNSEITSAIPTFGTVVVTPISPETSLLSAGGMFINEGSIVANGAAGSSFTLAISSGTVSGTVSSTFQPGYFINSNKIEVDAGNSMTITVAGTSAKSWSTAARCCSAPPPTRSPAAMRRGPASC